MFPPLTFSNCGDFAVTWPLRTGRKEILDWLNGYLGLNLSKVSPVVGVHL